jgi:hypothetical protein
LHGITTGEDLFLSVCKTMKELELPWTKNGGGGKFPSMMTAKKTGLMGRVRQEIDKQNPKF